ncbi:MULTISPECIES: flagellar hook-length control protein FliK [unclassified Janthinobacterium]|nr:flagellar hook-length control protein FliK [Janthinobacterium sp. CG_23.4]MDH6157681.1 flagellar hook-length control protein FliK [Janthinobacterium sp. CG_23.4]
MNFNTAPAAAAPRANAAPASAPAPALTNTLPGTPGYGSSVAAAANDAAPAALALFAQVLDGTGEASTEADTAAAPIAEPSNDADSQADSALPAMAAPVLGLPVTLLPPTDAATQASAGALSQVQTHVQTHVQTQVQANAAQANPALNISVHAAAITLTAQATAQAAGRDMREPLVAANPATTSKASAPAQPFESLLQQSVPATALAAPGVAAREGERGQATPPPAPNLGLTGVVSNTATPATAGDSIKLNGPAQQWQEPLREALGERLQTQIGRNSEHATIRLDPPMLGRIEISIRHSAGALQVNVTASNSEVLRQLQGIGENMRSDLAQRQYTDVAVNISATPRSPAAQAFAEGDARGQRQPGRQQDDAEPGRALSDGTPSGTSSSTTYAMQERETA